MAISASTVSTTDTLEKFRQEFNNLRTDVNAIDSGAVNITSLVYEGSTADAHETTIGVIDPTADRTINFPNESGTVMLSSSNITVADNGYVGSTSDTDAIRISSAGLVTMSQDLTVDGVLTVSGTTNLSSANVNITDSLLKFAKDNNSADAIDIGFYGLYDTSGSQDLYGGIFRDATDGKWRIFKDLQPEPGTTVNISGTGYAVGTLVANLEGTVTTAAQTSITSVGALDGGSITSNFGTINTGSSTITTTGAVSGGSFVVADGGNVGSTSDTDAMAISAAGKVTFSQAPQFTLGSDATADIFYRSSGGAISRLGVGTAGQVLTVNDAATAPEWSSEGAWTLVTTVDASSGTSHKITFDDATTDHYKLIFVNVIGNFGASTGPDDAAYMSSRLYKGSNASTVINGADEYLNTGESYYNDAGSGGSPSGNGNMDARSTFWTIGTAVWNDGNAGSAYAGMSGEMMLYNVAASDRYCLYHMTAINKSEAPGNNTISGWNSWGMCRHVIGTGVAITGIEFYWDGGETFVDGKIYVYKNTTVTG